MGKRCVDLADSEAEHVTPSKAPRRLKLTYSAPKDVKKGRKTFQGLSPEAKSEKSEKSEKSSESSAEPRASSVLANTPSRRDDIREEQERRFRLAVCQSAGAILRSRGAEDVELRRLEIYAYHAVQLYFMQKSFRHANFEVATLTAAFKALKDSGRALTEDDLIKELREQNGQVALEVRPEQLRQETALLEESLRSANGTTRCVDLLSLVDDIMAQLLKALTSTAAGTSQDLDEETRESVREAAHTFAVDSMFGPAALEFRPEILAAVVVAMGARWILPDSKEDILKQIHTILQEKNHKTSNVQEETRHATREVTQTLRLVKQR